MPNIALRLPDELTAAQIATAVRTELAAELAEIDTLIVRLTATRAGLLDNLTRLDVPVSSVAGGSGGSAGAHSDIA